MKNLKSLMYFLLLAPLLCASSYAIDIEFFGPCSDKPFHSKRVVSLDSASVGELTINVLEKSGIPFQGTSQSINQIMDTPLGLDAMEVISDSEMIAYGWCYEVNGHMPEVFPNEIPLDGIQSIRWFFGYAHYLNGEWISQCQKSYLRKSPFLCQDN